MPQGSDDRRAIEITSRQAVAGMVIVLLGSLGLLAKQIAVAKVPTRDACSFYLPLAKAWADGNFGQTQRLTAPPLYPLAVGFVSRLTPFARDPQELAGRLVGALCVLALVGCVYFIGRSLFSRRAGLVAAGLTGFNPYVVRYGANVGPEMLYAFLLAMMVVFLLLYAHERRTAFAVGVGLCASLAGLTRSEGIIWPAMAAVWVLILNRIARRVSWPRVAAHSCLVLVSALVLWTPRMLYVHGKTRYFVPDVRIVSVILPDDKVDPRWWWGPNQIGQVVFPKPGEPTRPYPASWLKERTWRESLKEAQEALLLVIGPATWALAVVWFLARDKLPRRGVAQLTIGAVMAAQIAVVAPAGVNSRFVTTVSPLAQLWGGLGAVCLMERLRRAGGVGGALGRSVATQTGILAVLLLALACWSVLGSNIGTREAALRELCQRAGNIGPDKVLMTKAPEVAYYTNLPVVYVSGAPGGVAGLGRDELRRNCEVYGVHVIAVCRRERWSSWLRQQIVAGELPAESIIAEAGSGSRSCYLLDASRLFEQ
ncbi:MAG: ArnT family glycosyltransferase [Planctomycetota bacterium]|jgi:hypothetical protein